MQKIKIIFMVISLLFSRCVSSLHAMDSLGKCLCSTLYTFYGLWGAHCYKEELFQAVWLGNSYRIRNFIERTGIDLNITDNDERTLLMAASCYGHIDIIDLLIENGADIDYVGENGWTAILYAIRWGREAVVAQLLKHGADINYIDAHGNSLLLYAVGTRNRTIIKMLLDAGIVVKDADILQQICNESHFLHESFFTIVRLARLSELCQAWNNLRFKQVLARKSSAISFFLEQCIRNGDSVVPLKNENYVPCLPVGFFMRDYSSVLFSKLLHGAKNMNMNEIFTEEVIAWGAQSASTKKWRALIGYACAENNFDYSVMQQKIKQASVIGRKGIGIFLQEVMFMEQLQHKTTKDLRFHFK